jgi:F-type H+-transporting ATPase subunit b
VLPFDLATMARVACETWCKRAGLAAVAALCAVTLASPPRAFAQAAPATAGHEAAAATPAEPGHEAPAASQPAGAEPSPAGEHAAPAAHAAAGHEGAAAEGHGESHEASPWGLIGKIVNFAIVAGVVFYFARKPFAQYLVDRGAEIRNDLVRARELKEDATKQIGDIDAKLKQLPAELDALRERGKEEVVAEEARINETAAQERERLLEQTRREIDLQLRTARRELVTHAADLSVQVARERIRARITDDDQARLVDRYLAQVKTND